MPSKSYKLVERTLSWKDAARNAIDEIQELADEMDDWASNTQGTNLEATQKYSDVESAAQYLQDAVYELQGIEEVDLNDLPDVDITYAESVHVNKKKLPSRAVRTDNIIDRLNEVVSCIGDLIKQAEDDKEANTKKEENYFEDIIEKLEQIMDIIDNTTDQLSSIEYPGMF
jgi:hypothetical protein